MMKEKVLVLNVSKWEFENQRGGKITWSNLDKVMDDNRSGLDILSASCSYEEALQALPFVPCVAELEFSVSAAIVNGKSKPVLNVTSISPKDEKKFSSNALSVSLNA